MSLVLYNITKISNRIRIGLLIYFYFYFTQKKTHPKTSVALTSYVS